MIKAPVGSAPTENPIARCPTIPFTNLESQDQEISEFYVVRKRRGRILKLQNCEKVGRVIALAAIFYLDSLLFLALLHSLIAPLVQEQPIHQCHQLGWIPYFWTENSIKLQFYSIPRSATQLIPTNTFSLLLLK